MSEFNLLKLKYTFNQLKLVVNCTNVWVFSPFKINCFIHFTWNKAFLVIHWMRK